MRAAGFQASSLVARAGALRLRMGTSSDSLGARTTVRLPQDTRSGFTVQRRLACACVCMRVQMHGEDTVRHRLLFSVKSGGVNVLQAPSVPQDAVPAPRSLSGFGPGVYLFLMVSFAK